MPNNEADNKYFLDNSIMKAAILAFNQEKKASKLSTFDYLDVMISTGFHTSKRPFDNMVSSEAQANKIRNYGDTKDESQQRETKHLAMDTKLLTLKKKDYSILNENLIKILGKAEWASNENTFSVIHAAMSELPGVKIINQHMFAFKKWLEQHPEHNVSDKQIENMRQALISGYLFNVASKMALMVKETRNGAAPTKVEMDQNKIMQHVIKDFHSSHLAVEALTEYRDANKANAHKDLHEAAKELGDVNEKINQAIEREQADRLKEKTKTLIQEVDKVAAKSPNTMKHFLDKNADRITELCAELEKAGLNKIQLFVMNRVTNKLITPATESITRQGEKLISHIEQTIREGKADDKYMEKASQQMTHILRNIESMPGADKLAEKFSVVMVKAHERQEVTKLADEIYKMATIREDQWSSRINPSKDKVAATQSDIKSAQEKIREKNDDEKKPNTPGGLTPSA